MYNSNGLRRPVAVLLVSSVALLWATPAAAQIPEADPIRVFVFCLDESSDAPIKDSGQNKSPIFEQFSGLLLACSETWTWKPPWS